MSDTVEIQSCLILPTAGKSLLLPNVAVAEIVDYQAPTPTKTKHPGFLGTILWRGMTLPLLSYEQINGQTAPESSINPRIAVLNTVGDKCKALPFIAVPTTGIPRIYKVPSDAIVEHEDVISGPAVRMAVQLDTDEMEIPNLEFLEAVAVKAMNL